MNEGDRIYVSNRDEDHAQQNQNEKIYVGRFKEFILTCNKEWLVTNDLQTWRYAVPAGAKQQDVPLVMGDTLLHSLLCPICGVMLYASNALKDKHCLGFVWKDKNGKEYIRSEYVAYRMNDDCLYKDFGVNNTEKYKKEYAKAVRFVKEPE